MDIKQTYNEWLENAVEDKDLKAELGRSGPSKHP